ncbi:MAG: 50S ribosomal protein L3 N(5)-glutamine methyltransferase, partial [Pseudohongiellaceae bacterium]
MNILDYITQVSMQLEESDSFYGHGTDNSRDEAAYLVCGTLGISHDYDLRTLNHNLDEEQLRILEVKVEQRIKDKIPTAYLVGEAWFAGLNFSVDKRVLIPRSPLAELIKNRFS